MLDDAVLAQGRRTKRKWKNSLILVFAALLAIAAAWIAERQGVLEDIWKSFLTRYDRGSNNVWIHTDYSSGAGAFCLGDSVVYEESGQISVMALDGTMKYRYDTLMEAPKLAYAQTAAICYESGGRTLIFLDENGIKTVDVPSGIDTAAVSDNGTVAVITAGSGYQTVTRLYAGDESLEASGLDICLTDSAMVMLTFLRESDFLASCLVTSRGDWVLRISLSEHTIEVPLGDTPVYDIKPCGDGAAVWDGNGISVYSKSGQLSASFSARDVICWDSDTFAAVLIRDGTDYQVVAITEDGSVAETAPLDRAPRDLSVCGNTVCVLDREELLIYDKNCILQGQTPCGASAAAVQAVHGGALLFGDGDFMRYLAS